MLTRGLSTREKGYDQNVPYCAMKGMISLAKYSPSAGKHDGNVEAFCGQPACALLAPD